MGSARRLPTPLPSVTAAMIQPDSPKSPVSLPGSYRSVEGSQEEDEETYEEEQDEELDEDVVVDGERNGGSELVSSTD